MSKNDTIKARVRVAVFDAIKAGTFPDECELQSHAEEDSYLLIKYRQGPGYGPRYFQIKFSEML